MNEKRYTYEHSQRKRAYNESMVKFKDYVRDLRDSPDTRFQFTKKVLVAHHNEHARHQTVRVVSIIQKEHVS